MDTMRRIAREYLSLIVALVLMIGISAALTSCGGGGDSDHGLCSQCGSDPDGPCLSSVEVDRDPDAPRPCDVPGDTPCFVDLDCFRKLGSAQRRCFPLEPTNNSSGPRVAQIDFECDGAGPNVSTPGPTATPTVTKEVTVTPTNTNVTITPTPFA
jgi:hypothetical protein